MIRTASHAAGQRAQGTMSKAYLARAVASKGKHHDASQDKASVYDIDKG